MYESYFTEQSGIISIFRVDSTYFFSVQDRRITNSVTRKEIFGTELSIELMSLYSTHLSLYKLIYLMEAFS